MDLALTAGMNEMNRDERDGRLTPPAETGRNGSTGGDHRQPRTNPRPPPGRPTPPGQGRGPPAGPWRSRVRAWAILPADAPVGALPGLAVPAVPAAGHPRIHRVRIRSPVDRTQAGEPQQDGVPRVRPGEAVRRAPAPRRARCPSERDAREGTRPGPRRSPGRPTAPRWSGRRRR